MPTHNEIIAGAPAPIEFNHAAFEVSVTCGRNTSVRTTSSLTAAFEFYFGAEIPADWQRIEVVEAATGERIAATDRSGNQFWR